MMLNSKTALTVAALVVALATGGASAEVPADCLDLAQYMSQIRARPDAQFMHHQLVDLQMRVLPSAASSASKPGLLNTLVDSVLTPKPSVAPLPSPSDLAYQHALKLFYHPNLSTLGLAAAKQGSNYLHDFTIYQLDCAKLVSGDIFAAEGRSVLWEIAAHDSDTLMLKRLSKGGSAELTNDLTLVTRLFKTLSPDRFVVLSTYAMDTAHACSANSPANTETSIAITTELFTIDDSKEDPKDPMAQPSPEFIGMMKHYPRTPGMMGAPGDFSNLVSASNDPFCKQTR